MIELLNRGQVESQIMAVSDALEEQTEVYADISARAADAEADYKLRFARAVVSLSDKAARMTAPEKQARAEIAAAEELRVWKITEARRQATKESLLSLRARLDALRTLNASIRVQT